ncbi:MAG TPA: hypothetical protein VJ782_02415 [Aeromicrobium sp.]|nr:hypothetical protein [Aeromicrobium sp.]
MSSIIASSPRRAAAAMALAVGLVVSACGPSDSELPTFNEPVKGDRVDPDSFLKALRSSFRAGSLARVSFDVRGGVGLQGGGAVRYTADGMDASLRIDDWQVEGASIDIRIVGGTTYMRVPESRGLWVNLDGAGTPGADLAKEADPRQAIGDLRDSIDEVRFSGVERIGGVASRRFQVVTRPSSKKGAGSDSAEQPTVAQYWFDEHGRVVRRQTELAQAGSATFTWTAWGEPVTIVRPKANTVVTVERLEQLRQEQAGASP